MTNLPAWADYKATLARIALAGARLTEAQTRNRAILDAAEQEFFDALRAYDVAWERAASMVSDGLEDVELPFGPRRM